mgnify:CR=1 FL=1
MKRAKKKARPAGSTARQATETGTTGQVASTSFYNDTMPRRGGQSIVAKAVLNNRKYSYREHFCAICCIQKVFTPNFSDTLIVELHNKPAELSLIQRHNLFDSRLFFYHRPGDPLFKLLLVGRVAEGLIWRQDDLLLILHTKIVLCSKNVNNGVNFAFCDHF